MEQAFYNRQNKKYEIEHIDSYSFVLKLANLPMEKQEQKQVPQWNLANPGGWEKFKEISTDKTKMVNKSLHT